MSTSINEGPARDNSPRRHSVAGAAGSVSAATMVSRVLGVLREMVMARYFGAGLYTDAFNVAYRIPNLLRDLFAEGALSSAFVPTFVRYLTQSGRRDAWLLANRVINGDARHLFWSPLVCLPAGGRLRRHP
jgi:putative peptidoglycan lipid II flippase